MAHAAYTEAVYVVISKAVKFSCIFMGALLTSQAPSPVLCECPSANIAVSSSASVMFVSSKRSSFLYRCLFIYLLAVHSCECFNVFDLVGVILLQFIVERP
jgi:hypothetical protein